MVFKTFIFKRHNTGLYLENMKEGQRRFLRNWSLKKEKKKKKENKEFGEGVTLGNRYIRITVRVNEG